MFKEKFSGNGLKSSTIQIPTIEVDMLRLLAKAMTLYQKAAIIIPKCKTYLAR
jgi:hypothetical protein